MICQKCYKSHDTFECPGCKKFICFTCLEKAGNVCPLCKMDLTKWDHEFGWLP